MFGGYQYDPYTTAMTSRVSQVDKISFWLLKFLDGNSGWLLTLVSGFLLGRVTNEFSLPNTSLQDILVGTFSITNRPANYLSWLSLILLVAAPLSRRALRRFHKKRQYAKLFELVLQKHKSRAIAPFSGLAWDEELSLQTCPELHRGWLASEVGLQHDTTRFSVPDRYKQAYKEYFDKYFQEKRFFDDGVKIMLTRNPASFSDTPTLVLHSRETLYSQVQFYRENVAILSHERNELIRTAVEGSIHFPHSLSMHMIVVTDDDRVLLTKRSEKVGYYPGTWSCSVEEQLSPQDFQKGADTVVQKWAERLLLEELGLNNEEYSQSNIRILSVFLESDILNVSLCTHVVVNLKPDEFNKRLFILPRTDYEFTEWKFLTHDELLKELLLPSRAYHPSSGYRMLMALIRRYGEPVVAEKFVKLT